MIYIEDSFISNYDCDYLISVYKKNQNLAFEWRDTHPISIFDLNDEVANNLSRKMKNYAEDLVKHDLHADTAEIVKWPVGSYMGPHIDPHGDVFAGLIYLNDDYSGGCTGFIDTVVTPRKGRFLIFYNSILEHWVTEIQDRDRFTFAIWLVQ
jgi:hypothetical protein